ncbi:MAG: hypothetical protein CMH28_06165 [Micavibrio sp.]|nr:hypothetical protein [Micavibrio sp.]
MSNEVPTQHPCHAYRSLMERHRNVGRLAAIAEIISRDFLTAMPEGAYMNRLDQISYLHKRIHNDIVCGDAQRELEEAQDHVEAHGGLWDNWDRANLQGMVDIFRSHSIQTPETMEESARIANEGRRLHREVLKKGDWSAGVPHLKRVVDFTRKMAEKKARWRGSATLYEALVQDYSPGLDLKTIWKWFNQLDRELLQMLPLVMERQSQRSKIVEMTGSFDPKAQMWLNRALIEMLGFDFDRGSLHETSHSPVEGGTPDDTRLVIKTADSSNFLDSLKSALHEGGHGLYTQGLPAKGEWAYQPVAKDLGTMMHESQALFVEMILGRTPEFFKFLAPRLEGLFHTIRDPSLTAENLFRIKTKVAPTLNRRKADEVTYFFHIFLRFQIECDLIEGKIEVEDIPAYWTEWMHNKLGIMPQNHAEGVLQDVHWFVGKFGYFQSYTLGHMVAAQIFEKMRTDIPQIFEKIERGDFRQVQYWLHKNIYSKGSLMPADALLKDVTGYKPSPDFLISHLENRYLSD